VNSLGDDSINWELLRKIRREKRIWQAEISDALGKSSAYYNLMENGRIKRVPLEDVKTIIKTLNLTPEQSKEVFGFYF
jgi:transcriptional regulator with XRE-family HTH domain